MKEYEIIYTGGRGVDHFQIEPHYVPLLEELFEGRDFDITPAEQAIPLIDAAKQKLQSDPDRYRELVGSGSLRSCRSLLDGMRRILVDMSGATISGLVDG